ncbi:hypothetical protein Hanom_Chr09g00871911 [Helianthus anomalus]
MEMQWKRGDRWIPRSSSRRIWERSATQILGLQQQGCIHSTTSTVIRKILCSTYYPSLPKIINHIALIGRQAGRRGGRQRGRSISQSISPFFT